MGARRWEDEAAQLVILANNGHQELEKERFSLALEDFMPNDQVAGVLREHSDTLLSLGHLQASQAKASPEISHRLKGLHRGLCQLAQAIQDQMCRPRRQLSGLVEEIIVGGICAGRAPNEEVQMGGLTLESEAVQDKARRILWYNWFFVSSLIIFVQTRLPPRGLGIRSWASAKAVPVVNAMVNRAFDAHGASAFYLYDAYSAIQHLLSGPALIQAKAPLMAEEAFARFSSEYTHFFPRGDMKQLYAPFISIAQLTNHSCVDVCFALGLSEVGARLRGVSLRSLHDEVGTCMAVRGPLMREVVFRPTPLRPPVLEPAAATTFDSLPPGSFDMLAHASKLGK